MEMSSEQQQALEQQKAQCPFCQIVAGKIPSKKVYEDDMILALLDIRPSTKGHVIIIPKEHYFIMPIIPPETFKHMVVKAKEISKAMKDAFLCEYTTVFIANGGAAGQQVAHFMLHIVPREAGDGLGNFEVPENEVSDADKQEVVGKVKAILNAMLEKNLTALGYKEADPNAAGAAGAAGAGAGGMPQKITKEQLLQVIEQNAQLKQLIITNSDEFKKMVPTHPQLKDLFANV
ncbi:HIT domain-containing protein, partial [Candidatus Woesearchaeota archaeon]|nr:HIT domain-containing protein [Candidatus Woesearchaeota archaeon]